MPRTSVYRIRETLDGTYLCHHRPVDDRRRTARLPDLARADTEVPPAEETLVEEVSIDGMCGVH